MAKLATIICVLFIFYLFWKDVKKPDSPSNALWIPLIWMFLAGSRWASSWLNLSVPRESADAYSEGSPVDRAVFFSLILAGTFILSKRKVAWNQLLSQNKLIVLYFLYCLSSIGWSDDPFVLVKRWIKDLGNPIMALVILTEQRPYEAVGTIIKRLSFLLIPLSVLFLRYYPDLGRSYRADGSPMYTGVGHQKNDLGAMCLITGIYFSWKFLDKRSRYFEVKDNNNMFDFLLTIMIAWLLRMSNSQTSLFCLVVVMGLFLAGRIWFIAQKPSRIITLGISSGLTFWFLEATLHVKDIVFEMLGRDSSLTNRTELWEVVKAQEVNPLIGAGFMSFWTGERMDKIAAKMGTMVNQAHSGYLEQYLNLGYIGVGFIAIIILSGLLKVRKHLDIDPPPAMLRLCFIVTAVLVNYTEASFYGINNLWLLLLLGIIDISSQKNIKGSEKGYQNEQKSKAVYFAKYRYKKDSIQGKQK